jgi:hypothetical protein
MDDEAWNWLRWTDDRGTSKAEAVAEPITLEEYERFTPEKIESASYRA